MAKVRVSRYKAVLSLVLVFGLYSLSIAPLYAKSDLQIDAGLRVAEVSWDEERALFGSLARDKSDTLYGMCVGVTNYNVWQIGRRRVIAAGFMDSIMASFSEHSATGATALLGPAFAATMGKVLTFQCAAAFSLGVLKAEPQAGYSDTSATVGFALDARVCFIPEGRAGPLLGVRYEYSKINGIFDRDVDRSAFCFYAGVAMQLSKW